MCGKAYDPRLIYAWPSAKIYVMGGASAAITGTNTGRRIKSQKVKMWMPKKEAGNCWKQITDRYNEQTTPILSLPPGFGLMVLSIRWRPAK